MNRRGFLGSLAALFAAVVAKVEVAPTEHLVATYTATFTPDMSRYITYWTQSGLWVVGKDGLYHRCQSTKKNPSVTDGL